jgi:hypothetical protein
MSCVVIEAELTGSTECSARGLTAHGPAPVLALCRALIGASYDPRRPLHVYRGQVLALKVRSIGEGARLTVADTHGRPRLRRMPPQDWMQEAHPLLLGADQHSALSGKRGAMGKAATDESEATKSRRPGR